MQGPAKFTTAQFLGLSGIAALIGLGLGWAIQSLILSNHPPVIVAGGTIHGNSGGWDQDESQNPQTGRFDPPNCATPAVCLINLNTARFL